MPTGPVYDGGSAMATALGAAATLLLGGLVKLAGFLAICFLGWLAADLLAGVAARLLRTVRFDDLALRAGPGGLAYQLRLPTGLAGVVVGVVRWSTRLIALVVALDVLGAPAGSRAVAPIVLWLPNVPVALMVVLIGGLSGRALHRLVRGSAAQAGIAHAELLGALARAAVWAFIVAVALTQLRIAADAIYWLFAGVVAALALGFGIAAGLGGQEAAGAVVARAYQALGRVELPQARPTRAAHTRPVAPAASPDVAPAVRRRLPVRRRRGLVGGSAAHW